MDNLTYFGISKTKKGRKAKLMILIHLIDDVAASCFVGIILVQYVRNKHPSKALLKIKNYTYIADVINFEIQFS